MNLFRSWWLAICDVFRDTRSLHRASPRWSDGSKRPEIREDGKTTAQLLKELKPGEQPKGELVAFRKVGAK